MADPANNSDPEGTIAVADNIGGALLGLGIGYGISLWTGEEYTFQDAALDAATGFASSGLSSLGKVAKLGKAARVLGVVGGEVALGTINATTHAAIHGGALEGQDFARAGAISLGAFGLGQAVGAGLGKVGRAVAPRLDEWSAEVLAGGGRLHSFPANLEDGAALAWRTVRRPIHIGNRRLPEGERPWPKYQRHVTGRDYEEMWSFAGRNIGVDGQRAGYTIEAKWTGRNAAAWRTSPYNPSSRYYDELGLVDQARRLLEFNSRLGGKGLRYAVSNEGAQVHFEQLFRGQFGDAFESGALSVWHVPGTGMK